jgi:hypothetical protein
MATPAALAAKKAVAIRQIHAAANRLAGYAGIEPVLVPAHARDTEHLQANQLEAIGLWLNRLADLIAPMDDEGDVPPLTDGHGIPVTDLPLDEDAAQAEALAAGDLVLAESLSPDEALPEAAPAEEPVEPTPRRRKKPAEG